MSLLTQFVVFVTLFGLAHSVRPQNHIFSKKIEHGQLPNHAARDQVGTMAAAAITSSISQVTSVESGRRGNVSREVHESGVGLATGDIRELHVKMANTNIDAYGSTCTKKHDGTNLILPSWELWDWNSEAKLDAIKGTDLRTMGSLAFPARKISYIFSPQVEDLLKQPLPVATAAAIDLARTIDHVRQSRRELEEDGHGRLSGSGRDDLKRMFQNGGGQENDIGKNHALFLEALFGDTYIGVPMSYPFFRFNYPDVNNVQQGKATTNFHLDACGFAKLFVGEGALRRPPNPNVKGCTSQEIPFVCFFAELLKRLHVSGTENDAVQALTTTLALSQAQRQQLPVPDEVKLPVPAEVISKIARSAKSLQGLDVWAKAPSGVYGVEAATQIDRVWGENFSKCLREKQGGGAVQGNGHGGLHPWIDAFVEMYNLHFLTVENADQALVVLQRQKQAVVEGGEGERALALVTPCDPPGGPNEKPKDKLRESAERLSQSMVLEDEGDAWIFNALGKSDTATNLPEVAGTLHAAVGVMTRGGQKPTRSRESVEFRTLVMKKEGLPLLFNSIWETCRPAPQMAASAEVEGTLPKHPSLSKPVGGSTDI
jgi:hypothetical protein